MDASGQRPSSKPNAETKSSSRGQGQPKYLKIVEALRKNLAAGDYSGGARMPSEAELTRRFKASRMTVVKAVQQLQNEGLLFRRVGSGTYATQVDASGGHVFGLLIPELGETDIFEPICRGMVRSPLARKHSLLWGHSFARSDDREEQARQLCRHYVEQKVTGVFFAPLEFSPHREKVNREILDILDAEKIPVVLLDRCGLPFPTSISHDLAGLDNRRAGYVVTEHLLQMGARNVAFLARHGSAETVQARIVGCREALFAQGKAPCKTLVMQGDTIDAGVVKALVRPKKGTEAVDAFVCANDHLAASLMKTLLGMRVRIPEDVRLAGFDDVNYAGLLPVPLTTMHQPCSAIGAAAMSAMLERLQDLTLAPRSILLDARLVIRRSCGSQAE